MSEFFPVFDLSYLTFFLLEKSVDMYTTPVENWVASLKDVLIVLVSFLKNVNVGVVVFGNALNALLIISIDMLMVMLLVGVGSRVLFQEETPTKESKPVGAPEASGSPAPAPGAAGVEPPSTPVPPTVPSGEFQTPEGSGEAPVETPDEVPPRNRKRRLVFNERA